MRQFYLIHTRYLLWLVYLLIILSQIDAPEASVQVPRAAQNLRLLGIANCHRGILESNYVALVA
jgi:hypothetical protein